MKTAQNVMLAIIVCVLTAAWIHGLFFTSVTSPGNWKMVTVEADKRKFRGLIYTGPGHVAFLEEIPASAGK
jgi:hypothetical protein